MGLKQNSRTGVKKSSGSIGSWPGKRSLTVSSSLGELGPTPYGNVQLESYGDNLYDCCAFVIYCTEHNNIAMSRGGKGLWLPFIILRESETWMNGADDGLKQILSHGELKHLKFTKPAIVDIFRLQLPEQQNFITRIICFVKLSKNDGTDHQCCKAYKKMEWFASEEVLNGNVESLWGPEPEIYAQQVLQDRVGIRQIREYSLDDAMMFAPHDPPKNDEEELLKSAMFTPKDISKLYGEYIQRCYPSECMTYSNFLDFMIKIGWQVNDIRLASIFRAFGFLKKTYLTFHELLLGLGAMDQAAEHGGGTGRLRYGYIFRYYDVDGDGFLEYQDIVRMTLDICKSKDVEPDETAIEKETKTRMQALGLKETDMVSMQVFLDAVSNLSFRGTSVLFRSPIQNMQQILRKSKFDHLEDFATTNCGISRRTYKGVCHGCRMRRYKLALHTVKLDFNGRICEPLNLIETDGKDVRIMTEDTLTEHLRHYSKLIVFNSGSGPNSVLDALRQYDTFMKKNAAIKSNDDNEHTSNERKVLINSITALCLRAEDIFAEEQRCVHVCSPTFIFGDIHGNFTDLMSYERLFWKMGPSVSHSSYLFLGDYVDRGEYGIECVAYLLSLKILAPDKYFLCRGNHEIRSIQKVFTFQRECTSKYGSRIGLQIWETMNKVFDKMPICAIVDQSIYCAHGGIPMSIMKLEDLQKIPTPLSEPEGEAPAAWEIMWNDPMNSAEYNEMIDFMKIKSENNHGFIANAKRGTAFYYTEEAVDNFLEANGLTHIVRAHEVMPIGYKFHMGGKVITIFSCANYCNGSNEAACLFADDEKIRVIRIETSGQLE